MFNLSSSATLGLKVFFPTLWITFFTFFTIAIFFTSVATIGNIPVRDFRIALAGFYLISLAIVYKTFMSLKRVDSDGEFIFISNYYSTRKYPIIDIESITMSHIGAFRIAKLTLKAKGSFGQSVIFLPSRRRWQKFLDEHKEWEEIV